MVSYDKHNFCFFQRGKQIVDFFELAHQWLSVKQISCDQQQIHFLSICLCHNTAKALPDLASAFFTPRKTGIRDRSQVCICYMKKLHDTTPFL